MKVIFPKEEPAGGSSEAIAAGDYVWVKVGEDRILLSVKSERFRTF